MPICNSRKSTSSIMSHSGFGSVTLIKAGLQFIIPQQCIDNFGFLLPNIAKRLTANITIEDAQMLSAYGVNINKI